MMTVSAAAFVVSIKQVVPPCRGFLGLACAVWLATFDGDGGLVRMVGRQGGGPGDLKRPAFLGLGPADDISVFDHGKGVLVRWDSSGDVLPELVFPHRPTKPGLHHALTENGFLVSTFAPLRSPSVSPAHCCDRRGHAADGGGVPAERRHQ